jgi:hypothetical protein
MAFSQGPFDNSLLKEIDDARATRTENDDSVLLVLDSLCELSSFSEDPNVLKTDRADRMYAEAVQMPRTITLPATAEIDKDQLIKLSESYEQDTKLANTMLAFANDLGETQACNEEMTKVMRTLHQSAIPQLVAK